MEQRRSLTSWLLLGVAVLLFVVYGWPALTGKTTKSELQPLAGIVDDTAPPHAERAEEQLCPISGPRFRAVVTSKGGALRHLYLDDAKYQQRALGKEAPIDLVTTSMQSRLPLRTDLRAPPLPGEKLEAPYSVAFDDFDWQLKQSTATSCTFRYEDDSVLLQKTIATDERPFELTVSLAITNKAKEKRLHRLTVESDDWRSNEETKSSFAKRQSEFQTDVEIYADSKMERSSPSDFRPKDFADQDFTAEKWLRAPKKWREKPATGRIAAVSSTYFSKALIPVRAPVAPAGEALIEEFFHPQQYPQKEKDPEFGHTYRARLNYGFRTLDPGQSADYELLVFAGPKEREALAHAGGGGYRTTELLNLGFFGSIGKLLIRYLYLLFSLVRSWGWAICLLTITVKFALFPLSIAQIKSTMAMRKLKPEMDAINAKYKNDAQQRGLALQELWRKNKVTNPMLGCLPVALQLPVWWALYSGLQTAVELYHTPFGPFIPDLSAPGKYFIIPILLGASSLLQQQLMPMQGDAQQQKMMKWMMPTIFTVMMLFLPAGLGIYFLTNTWLGILQQLGVERYYKSQEDKKNEAAAVEAH